jgi:hypothetical protein
VHTFYAAGWEAGGGEDEQESADEREEEEVENPASSGRIPIPPETFLEELSQKLEIHPISVYWLIRELREEDGVISAPELQRFVSDYFRVTVLRMLGHQWRREIEAKDPVPHWAEPSGIIPITEGTGHENLIAGAKAN